MSDGDIVHDKLPSRYRKAYQWVCENKADNDECARQFLKALIKDIQGIGDSFVNAAKQIEKILESAFEEISDLENFPWFIYSQKIDSLLRKLDASHYEIEQILLAGKKVLQSFRYGRSKDYKSIAKAIIEQFIRERYESSFKGRIPVDEHYQRITEVIDPIIHSEIDRLAQKADKEGGVSNFKLPQYKKIVNKKIVTDDNIGSIIHDEDLL